MRGQPQERYLDFLDSLNREHLRERPGELDLEARIASYELAARMQTAAREALDIAAESPAVRRLYGIDDPATADFGTRCLIARRLVERGVRFVQICTRNQYLGPSRQHPHRPARVVPVCGQGLCRRSSKT